MQFGLPWGLLALLGVPLIVLLYSLRPRRRDVTLSSVSLWQEALRERPRGVGWRRLLRDLELLALLALAVLLGLALAHPLWQRAAPPAGDVVLVLDRSASMQASPGGGASRFERALQVARAEVDGLAEGGRALIMSSARQPQLHSAFEADPARLRRVLEGLRPSDEAGRPGAALELALSLLHDRERGRVLFITDGAFDVDLPVATPALRVHRVAEDEPASVNVAITRFDLRAEVGNPQRWQVLLGVRNYADRALRVPAEVRFGEQPVWQRELDLAPGAEQTLVVAVDAALVTRAEARVLIDDDLAVDNRAHAVASVQGAVLVALYARDGRYVRHALANLPGVVLTEYDPATAQRFGAPDADAAAARPDVVVFAGVAPPRLAPGSYLLVDALVPGLPFSQTGEVRQPRISGSASSALLRGVDLAGVHIEAARRVQIAAGAEGVQPLFWSDETPLALTSIDAQRRLVYLGFDPGASDLPLRPAFPLLLAQAMDWLAPAADRQRSTQALAGEPQAIVLPAGLERLRVQGPAGVSEHAPRAGQVLFRDTGQTGFYRYQAGNLSGQFAVNLTDAAESDLRPRAAPATRAGDAGTGAQALGASEAARALRPLWPYLTLAALVLALLEWGLWCRGRTGA